MRKNFAQVLKEANVDISREYSRLYRLLYGKDDNYKYSTSLYEDINSSFSSDVWFRGTALDLDDFNEEYGFNFEESPRDFDLLYLVRFCEYFYNLVLCLHLPDSYYLDHIHKVIERIGFIEAYDGLFTIFVEKDPAAISVSELLPPDVSYKVISYNHYSMRGNIEAKKETLLKLISLLEPKDKELYKIDAKFKSDLFNAFNNLNLRHNNIDPLDRGHFKQYVATMDKEELEKWYDEIYQMCLLAFLRLEHEERKPRFDELMEKVNEK